MTKNPKAPAADDLGGIRLSDVTPEEVRWIWHDRFPVGMLSVVGGRQGLGKSQLLASIAADLSHEGGVLFSSLEDTLKHTVMPRIKVAGGNLDNVHAWHPLLPRDIEELARRIEAWNIKAVLLDPIAAHLSVSIFNDQEVRKALAPLTALAEATDCTFVAVTHLVKHVSGTKDPIQAFQGSGAGLTAAARCAYTFGRNPEDATEVVLAMTKCNVGPPKKSIAFEIDHEEMEVPRRYGKGTITTEVPHLVYVGEVDVTDRQILHSLAGTGNATGKRGAEKRENAAAWVTQYLRLGPRPSSDLFEDALQYGISKATLRRAAEEDVGIEKYATGARATRVWWWRLPDGHPSLVVDGEDGDDE